MTDMCLNIQCPSFTRCKLSVKPSRGKYKAYSFIVLQGNMRCEEFKEMRQRDDGSTKENIKSI